MPIKLAKFLGLPALAAKTKGFTRFAQSLSAHKKSEGSGYDFVPGAFIKNFVKPGA